jgi:glycosyltransferase involved in cell wall biosynthesis
MRMKVIILGNQARSMVNFWTVLIRSLLATGHDVLCLVPAEGGKDAAPWTDSLAALGARLAHYPLDRKGLNPLRDLSTLLALAAFFRKEQADLLFASTIKPVIYGSLAASLAGTPAKEQRHVMITGLGYMFEADSPFKRILTRLACLLYRLALSRVHTVFFQNEEDKATFDRLALVPSGVNPAMSRGTGVDLHRFAPAPLPEGPPVFLLMGRLLEAKGLRDDHAAASLLKRRYPDARFRLLGPPEQGPGAVPPDTVRAWHAEGTVEYLGEAGDVRPYIAAAHVLVLPSYREGTPTAVMEGMSMGRAVVVSDVPGCRETVREGENGFLIPARDARALARGMERFLLDADLAQHMGLAGRRRAEEDFDATRVAKHIMEVMGLECSIPKTGARAVS